MLYPYSTPGRARRSARRRSRRIPTESRSRRGLVHAVDLRGWQRQRGRCAGTVGGGCRRECSVAEAGSVGYSYSTHTLPILYAYSTHTLRILYPYTTQARRRYSYSYSTHTLPIHYTGQTAVYLAAQNGRLESIQCLVEGGADVNQADAHG
jgi:hypothetical protein